MPLLWQYYPVFQDFSGNMAAVAGAGYAKNLRHDIFYKVQEFSFKNMGPLQHPGLVTYDNRYYKYSDGI